MKYLARVWTSALTFGALMVAGSTAASAHRINNRQPVNHQQTNQNTRVVNHKRPAKVYPLYHFRNAQNSVHLKTVTPNSAIRDQAKSDTIHKNVANYKISHHNFKTADSNDSDYSKDDKAAKVNHSAKTYSYQGNTYSNRDSYRAARFSNSKMAQIAHQKLGDPYVWGATGANAFDCSGFTQYLYRNGKHINLPRTAQAQYDAEKHVSYNHVKPGNLVFFGYSPSSISHVGMYIGNGKMIDAQNRGVIIENVKAPWWNLVGCAKVRRNLDLD